MDDAVRLRLDLGYDGTDFSGWAPQPQRRTVAGVLLVELSRVLGAVDGLTVAGRTDAGVHATGQVCHVDARAEAWAGVRDTLVRRLAYLYGGRPGTLGLIRLMRAVIAHLALTGGMAASDSVIQQVLGHGIAAKLSVRLGEGVLNGLLTARVGLAAIDVTRPLPFAALPPPTLTDVAGNLLQRRGEKAEVATAADA